MAPAALVISVVPMAVSVLSRKKLWGRSGNRCALACCRTELIEQGPAGLHNLGEEAHIVAKERNGPRGESDLPEDRRDDYENLILLCPLHHTLIDTDVATYPIPVLVELKAQHEVWVRETLGGTAEQELLERYAEIVDGWASRSRLSQWTEWSYYVANSTGPTLHQVTIDSLTDLNLWLFALVWPSDAHPVRQALTNFRLVLADFLDLFNTNAGWSSANGALIGVRRPDRRQYANPTGQEYYTQLKETLRNIGLIEDLLLELTRAANYVCDVVRRSLSPRFRAHDGVLIVRSGPYEEMQDRYWRPEYGEEERRSLYPGIADFEQMRSQRDISFGVHRS